MVTPEEFARQELIDPALEKARWDVSNPEQVGLEIPVDGFDPDVWKQLENDLRQIRDQANLKEIDLPAGISDYVLYRENGEILGVVEAKKTSIDPRLAQAQTEFYVTQLEQRQSFRPFGFMSNGNDIYFYDVGYHNKRQVHGFFSRQDLENLLHIRKNRIPLTEVDINREITDRTYQMEAIRRVAEVFEAGKRRALLTMATGTGKTRVAMSLVDLFLRANQAQHILFIADRKALVEQGLEEGFNEHIPDEPATRLYSHRIDTTNRLYVVTLQTINNIFDKFTPAFFDLIIFDEVHRSIFNKWNEVLHYFDGRMIGLTATPANFINRNTFLEFDCHDNVPTFLYSYQEAIDEDYLVDYDLAAAQTRFQRKGIHGIDLSEEDRNVLIEQGRDPDDLDYSGQDIERRVSNKDTLRRQWEEFWDKCLKDESGQLPGKTIVFAMTQDHALRLAEVFEEMFPQYPDLVQVITYKSEYKGSRLIDKFKKENWPRIAISVDMLETGVNVPEAVNLVFMRPVQSHIKLQQMIGRGTRTNEACKHPQWLPKGHKDGFLIIDFWDNDFSKEPDTKAPQSLPVLVTIFNTRLKLLANFLDDQHAEGAKQVITDLRAMIDLIPTDALLVKKALPDVEQAWGDSFWRYITKADIEFLHNHVGPLLRYAPGIDVQAQTFISKVERLKLQIQTGINPKTTAKSIAEDVSRLPNYVFEDVKRKEPAELCISPELLTASVDELNQVIEMLAKQMKNRRKVKPLIDLLDLSDEITTSGYIILRERPEPIFYEEYRRLVTDKVLALIDEHPTIDAISRGEPVTDIQLLELERTLREELGSGDMELTEENIRRAYRMQVTSMLEFLRNLLELDDLPGYEEVVNRQFSEYMATHTFNGDQIRFLRGVQSVFLQKRRLELADLYDPPLDSFGQEAVERWFEQGDIEELLSFTETLSVV
ncbi:MAG: DEAD/DEAH box helicase family protein [Anaerolineales bacterium]|nr:DEAD/DEAH box helicase family protein [Chloroflexota bacterium]MBL6983478.1 DEAD/DEAH box helicase family protein [Anaerolineales bacterium]